MKARDTLERPFTPFERDHLIRSVQSSMALSGLEIDYETCERLFNEALEMPPLELPLEDMSTDARPHPA